MKWSEFPAAANWLATHELLVRDPAAAGAKIKRLTVSQLFTNPAVNASTNAGLTISDGVISGRITPSTLGGLAVFATSNHALILGTNNSARLTIGNAGRTFIQPNSEPYGLALQYSASGGPVYLGAIDNSGGPGLQISNAGGGVMANFVPGSGDGSSLQLGAGSVVDSLGGNLKAELRLINNTSAAQYNYRVNQSNAAVWEYWNGASWFQRMQLNASGQLGLGGINASALLELAFDSAKKPSTNTWTISSDERLKEKIVPADLDRCVEIVEALPLKRWAWPEAVYSSKRVRDRAKLGWTAQDVAKVFPKAVEPSEFALEPVEDGIEQAEEQVTAKEEREVVTVEIVNGLPTQKTRVDVVDVPQFDMVGIVDERGEPVMVEIEVESESGLTDAEGRPLTEKRRVQAMHQVPRMRKVTRPKMRVDKIPDALAVNNDQVFMAMFGALQRALGRIRDLERDVAALKAAPRH